ncbi:hypothetical protein AGOR_G00068710 [Albula goreensis]|uniref:Uncharacterized protein n=1 Tax=Albula goreensis TaxID=1534307 RepID=A0A8T3DUZ4_9TELE|nr:hypothetical protein AGOR_G00068710 [Albula goreensis]
MTEKKESEEEEWEKEELEGVSRVRVTSRRSPQKVERVCGVVTSSQVEMPKVSGRSGRVTKGSDIREHFGCVCDACRKW